MAKPKWDALEIKTAVHRKKMTLTRLAELNDINPNSFRNVWTRTHRKAEAALAAFLDVPVEELFPTRYPVRTSRILSSKYAVGAASPKTAALRNAA